MKFTSREYQERLINAIIEKMIEGKRRIVAVAPTGAGKTIIMAIMAAMNKSKGTKVAMFTHRSEIHGQNIDDLIANGLKACVMDSKYKGAPDPDADIYVCMVQTFMKRIDRPSYMAMLDSCGMVYVDEAHRGEYRAISDYLMQQNKRVVYFSATPVTADKERPMMSFTDDIVFLPDVDVQYLQSIGCLLYDKYYTTKEAIKYTKANYSAGEETFYQEKNKTKGNTLAFYQKHAAGKKSIMACPSIEQCFERAKEFEAAGYPCAVAIGGTRKHTELLKERYGKESYTPDDAREEIDRFKRNEVKILVSVDKVDTGLNVTDIECVIVDRSLNSLTKWFQLLGRGGRPHGDMKEFIILDPHGCIRGIAKQTGGMGMWSDKVDWSFMYHNPKLKSVTMVIDEGKVCKKCGKMQRKTIQICECGHVFSVTKEKEIVTEGVELKRNERPTGIKTFGQCLNLEELAVSLEWERKNEKAALTAANWKVLQLVGQNIIEWNNWACALGKIAGKVYKGGYGRRLLNLASGIKRKR